MLSGIDGPGTVCDNSPQIFSANVIPASNGTPGQPPFTYQWRWNTTAQFISPTNQLLGTYLGDTESITIGNLNGPWFYLFLSVSSSDEVHTTRIKKIRTNLCPECSVCGEGTNGYMAAPHMGAGTLSGTSFRLSPNPVRDNAELTVLTEAESAFSYALSDAHGKVIHQSGEQLLEKGKYNFKLPTDVLIPGLYFRTTNINGKRSSLKLVIVE